MRRIALVLLLAVGLIGCATVKQKLGDIGLCWHNDSCRETQLQKSSDLGNKAEGIAGLSGIPWASKVAHPLVSYISLIVFLASAGGVLRKNESVQA